MNARGLLFSFALWAIAPMAWAQGIAPPPAESDDALVPPPLPEVPVALQPAVAALASTVTNTEECYTLHGERMEHTADRRCPQWYARLARGGPAAVYAIGEVFRPTPPDPGEPALEPIRGGMAGEARGVRLVRLMARTGSPEAVPFLLSYFVRTATLPDHYASSLDTAVIEGLRSLTGDDPAPTAPWQTPTSAPEATDLRRTVAQQWLRWFRSHQDMTVAQWRAEGAARASRDLFSDDIVARYSAIERLAADPTQRVATRTALHTLLARPDLPAAARVHLHRLARQRRIALPARPVLAAR